MSPTSFDAATRAYTCTATARYTRHLIGFAPFRAYCRALRELTFALDEEAGGGYWLKPLQAFRRYQWEHILAPIGFGVETVGSLAVAECRRTHASCQRTYPAHVERLQAVWDTFDDLEATRKAPLLTYLWRQLEVPLGERWGIVVPETRYVQVTERSLEAFDRIMNAEVFTPADLRQLPRLDRLVLAGPGACFPEHVLGAPRAATIDMLVYDWINDNWRPSPLLPGLADVATEIEVRRWDLPMPPSYRVAQSRPAPGPAKDEPPFVEPEPWVHRQQLDQLAASFGARPADAGSEEFVDARLVRLDGEIGVFFEQDGNVFVLDTDDDGDVRSVKVDGLQPDMFVLIKHGGCRDLVREIADRILKGAPPYRDYQREWKRRLRNLVAQRGEASVLTLLKARGCNRANVANLRHWMTDGCIRTKDHVDFQAIMRVIGLPDQAQTYWDGMYQIDCAHKQAGHRIRDELIGQVASADLGELEQVGRKDFFLSGSDSVRLTAYRVLEVHPDPIVVPVDALEALHILGGT